MTGLFYETSNRNIYPDVVTYNSLINGLCKADKLQEALQLLDVMGKMGHQPNEITYNTLLNGFCRVGNLEKVRALLQELPEKGCRPKVVSYSTLINGLLQAWQDRQSSTVLL